MGPEKPKSGDQGNKKEFQKEITQVIGIPLMVAIV
jgi:uncharacterized protein (DUF927 family)